ncbi:protein FAM200C-like [Oratosquilla oratoria]|uniref:protein FAM200C-like n=1 Tax=Oratosquilla oratoria TaxID=337810 RepID=UPI003F7757DD
MVLFLYLSVHALIGLMVLWCRTFSRTYGGLRLEYLLEFRIVEELDHLSAGGAIRSVLISHVLSSDCLLPSLTIQAHRGNVTSSAVSTRLLVQAPHLYCNCKIHGSKYQSDQKNEEKRSPQVIMSKKRTYSEAYLYFSFTFVVNNGEHLPQYVICTKTLGNGSMKPFQQKQRLQGCHPELQNKDREYFKLKQNYLKKMRLDSTGTFRQQTDAIVKASCEVSYKIAREKKPHTVGETLVKPCMLQCVKLVLGEAAHNKMTQISLSNSTIRSRINYMAESIKNQVVQKTTTKAQDVMGLINDFFEDSNITRESLVGVCTDGAPAMLGSPSGFITFVKQKNPAVESTHCLIHKEVLASRTLPKNFKQHLETVINVVKWLSKGNMLQRVLELFDEVVAFLLAQEDVMLLEALEGEFFRVRLAYLSDIFSALNELNSKLQGKGTNILFQSDKIRAFVAKLELWKKRAGSGSFSSFLALNECVEDMEDCLPDPIAEDIKQHLEGLEEEFKYYFPGIKNESNENKLIRDPFQSNVDDVPDVW